MTTVADAFAAARAKLPAAEARMLLGHVIERPIAWLIAHDDEGLGEDALRSFASLVARRSGGEPMAYLLGHREFYGRRFSVGPGVLIPRPETELLVDLAIAKVGTGGTPNILDLGCGSACIAATLALEIPGARVTAVDRSPIALTTATENARRLGAGLRVVESDWFADLEDETFDAIVSNPPYVADGDPHLSQGDLRHEPREALAAGPDGLGAIRRILAAAGTYLVPGGWILVEHGYDQGKAVPALMSAAGFTEVTMHCDLAGLPRATVGRRVP